MPSLKTSVLLCIEDKVLEMDLELAMVDAGYQILRCNGHLPRTDRPIAALIDADQAIRKAVPLMHRLRRYGTLCLLLHSSDEEDATLPSDIIQLRKPVRSEDLVARVTALSCGKL